MEEEDGEEGGCDGEEGGDAGAEDVAKLTSKADMRGRRRKKLNPKPNQGMSSWGTTDPFGTGGKQSHSIPPTSPPAKLLNALHNPKPFPQ